MKKITQAALILTFSAGSAFAMSEAMGLLDTNGDGMLSLDEVQAGFPEVTGDAFLTMDVNADGMLDTDEVSAAQTAGLLPATEG